CNNTTDALLLTLLEKLGVNDIGSSCTSNVNPSPVVTNAMPVAAYSVPGPAGLPTQPAQQQVQPIQSPIGPLMMAQPTGTTVQPAPQPGNMGPTTPSGQATMLPYAFTKSTLHDPASRA
ncbi:hypothetical protein Tco_1115897, partial [Tanacetum coccineum]